MAGERRFRVPLSYPFLEDVPLQFIHVLIITLSIVCFSLQLMINVGRNFCGYKIALQVRFGGGSPHFTR